MTLNVHGVPRRAHPTGNMKMRLRQPSAWMLLVVASLAVMQVVAGASVAKRSLSALARTSQLPHSSTAPADQAGHDQDHGAHGGQTPGQHEKRSELQEEAIREELLRQRAAPATEALLSAIMAADQYGGDNGVEDKRSLSSLARYGNLPAPMEDKRSLSSLARYGNLPAPMEDKRSLSSLARYGNLPSPTEDKRSISSLARYDNLPVSMDEKRSLSSLARYGNLPAAPSEKRSLEALARGGLLTKNSRVDVHNNKRSLSALARAGELPGKRWMPPHQREQTQDLVDMLQRELEETKRSLSSLARSGDLNRPSGPENLPFPLSVAEQQVKRSLESLVRNWKLPEVAPKRSPSFSAFDLDDDYPAWGLWGKRNAAALLRQTKFSTNSDGTSGVEGTQRDDVESEHHAQGRRKRSLWDDDMSYGEVALPYVQSTANGQEQDWEQMWSPSAWGAYFGYGEDLAQPPQQKRFLGSVARSWGSWRPASRASPTEDDNHVVPSKRHIGALARSGLLPAFRSLRYARSGRAVALTEGLDEQAPRRVPGFGRFSAPSPREDPEYGPPPTKD